MWGHANTVQKTCTAFIAQGILFAFVTNEINADVSCVCQKSSRTKVRLVHARVFNIELTFLE